MKTRSATIRTAIIGGGITGLVAAYQAQKSGEEVLLFEPAELGGLIKTEKKQGFNLELGPNVFVEKGEFAELISELRLKDSQVYPRIENYKQLIWTKNGIRAVPKSLKAFLKSDIFSFFDKLRIPLRALLPFILKPKSGDESVTQFFSRLLGKDLVNILLDPVLKGIYGGRVDKLSARLLFPSLWGAVEQGKSLVGYLSERKKITGGKSPKIFVFKGGNQSLVEKLVLELKDSSQIIKEKVALVTKDPSGYKIKTASSHYLADKVYIATSGQASAQYLSELLPLLCVRLRDIIYAPLVVVHAMVTKNDLSRTKDYGEAFGILFPSSARAKILGVMFNSEIFPHVAPEDKHLLTICLGGMDFPEIISKSEEVISEITRLEVQKYLSINIEEVLAITKWEKAIPQYEVGHFRLGEVMKVAQAQLPGLKFIGADWGGVGVADRVGRVRDGF